jgi:hypothetical protein
MLKGQNKFETAENLAIIIIVVGAAMLTIGIGLAAVMPKGVAAILAMLGTFVAFAATVALIVVWLVKEFFSE